MTGRQRGLGVKVACDPRVGGARVVGDQRRDRAECRVRPLEPHRARARPPELRALARIRVEAQGSARARGERRDPLDQELRVAAKGKAEPGGDLPECHAPHRRPAAAGYFFGGAVAAGAAAGAEGALAARATRLASTCAVMSTASLE